MDIPRRLVLLGLATAAPPPALAQSADGIDDDGDGEVDELGEDVEGGDMGRMEAVRNATARIDACLPAHDMSCQRFGLPQSCALVSIGNTCNGGDPGRCGHYQEPMTYSFR